MTIDLHGLYPADLVENGLLTRIVQQAWETGAQSLCLIHGHGHNRGLSPGFVHTNTGYLGITVRRALRHSAELRSWIAYTTLDCKDPGLTTVNLKRNATPTRLKLDDDLLG